MVKKIQSIVKTFVLLFEQTTEKDSLLYSIYPKKLDLTVRY